MVCPDNQIFPTVVIESGWSESFTRLMDDMNLWLVGGNGSVNAVIILKWKFERNSASVTGVAELYACDSNGMPTLRQSEVFSSNLLFLQTQMLMAVLGHTSHAGASAASAEDPNYATYAFWLNHVPWSSERLSISRD